MKVSAKRATTPWLYAPLLFPVIIVADYFLTFVFITQSFDQVDFWVMNVVDFFLLVLRNSDSFELVANWLRKQLGWCGDALIATTEIAAGNTDDVAERLSSVGTLPSVGTNVTSREHAAVQVGNMCFVSEVCSSLILFVLLLLEAALGDNFGAAALTKDLGSDAKREALLAILVLCVVDFMSLTTSHYIVKRRHALAVKGTKRSKDLEAEKTHTRWRRELWKKNWGFLSSSAALTFGFCTILGCQYIMQSGSCRSFCDMCFLDQECELRTGECTWFLEYNAYGGLCAYNCPEGQVNKQDDYGNWGCADCEVGFFPADDVTCELCPLGKNSFQAGVAACTDCEVGKYGGGGSNLCLPCPADHTGADVAPGQSDYESACLDGCPIGSGVDCQGDCEVCRAGMVGLGGAEECKSCPKGTFWKSEEGNGTHIGVIQPRREYMRYGVGFCSPCEFSTYSNEGTTECTACTGGKELVAEAMIDGENKIINDNTAATPFVTGVWPAAYQNPTDAELACTPCDMYNGLPQGKDRGTDSYMLCEQPKCVVEGGYFFQSSEEMDCRMYKKFNFNFYRDCGWFGGDVCDGWCTTDTDVNANYEYIGMDVNSGNGGIDLKGREPWGAGNPQGLDAGRRRLGGGTEDDVWNKGQWTIDGVWGGIVSFAVSIKLDGSNDKTGTIPLLEMGKKGTGGEVVEGRIFLGYVAGLLTFEFEDELGNFWKVQEATSSLELNTFITITAVAGGDRVVLFKAEQELAMFMPYNNETEWPWEGSRVVR